MNQGKIIAFFDALALHWDEECKKNDEIINKILDGAGVRKGSRVLDVACGTGVLIPYYSERGAAVITAVDISPKMVQRAKSKFKQPNVNILCADIESLEIKDRFDCIVVYNALPHFPSPKRLFSRLAALLAPGGTLTIAHGAGRSAINACHSGAAAGVSLRLPAAEEIASLLPPQLSATLIIDTPRMYQITAVKPV